jgi:hypothetical protein
MEPSSVYLDVQLLSFAIATGEISQRVTKTPKDPNYSIRILDNETGFAVIYHGKHWSLVSLQKMIEWRRNDVNPQPI